MTLLIQYLAVILIISLFAVTLCIVLLKIELDKNPTILSRLLPKHGMTFKEGSRGVTRKK